MDMSILIVNGESMLRKLLIIRFILSPAILSSAVFTFPSKTDGDYVYENFISLKLLAEIQEKSGIAEF